MARLTIDEQACTGCGACLEACLFGALSQGDGGLARLDCERCTLCGACVTACPAAALALGGGQAVSAAKDDYRGVWVVAEQWRGEIQPVALELLSEARRLAGELDEELCAVLLGHALEGAAAELFTYGARRVYLFDDAALELPEEERYAHLLTQLIQARRPNIVLFGATAFGRALAPRLAARCRTGLTADCTSLAVDATQRLLLQTRPAFGGNVLATILCREQRPQMATVRPQVLAKQPLAAPPAGELVRLPVNWAGFQPLSRVLEVIPQGGASQRLEEAEIVVAAGAGIATPENFALVTELARLLGGAVGASRAAVDLGLAPVSSQIGQTGKVIAPQLYIACGIAGAVQHQVGMANAGCIVALNRDPEAAIFQIADYGLVGDVAELLREMIRRLQAMES